MNASAEKPAGKTPSPRVEMLDVARGLAALIVVLFHYGVIIPRFVKDVATIPIKLTHGLYGVHLFFIVSGFVILLTLERSTPRQFVVSRVTRLYPAYWLACTLTFGLLIAFQPFPYPLTFREFLINLTMLQSFLKVEAVDGVYWSLAYELGFYIFMFAVFRLGLRRFTHLLPAYMVAGAVLFHFAQRYIPHPLHMLLMIHQYGHLFGCGLALYLLRTRGSSWLQWGVVIATPLVQMLNDQMLGLVAGVTIVAIMTFACLARIELGRAARPLVWLGSISYSLYLIHQMLGYALIGWLQQQGLGAWSSTLLTVAAALLVAHIITFYWERPFAASMKQALSGKKRKTRTAVTA